MAPPVQNTLIFLCLNIGKMLLGFHMSNIMDLEQMHNFGYEVLCLYLTHIELLHFGCLKLILYQ